MNAPRPSPRIAELIRRGAREVADPGADWLQELHDASLSGGAMASIGADPVLVESTRRANVAILLGWIAHNIEHPGERVPPSTAQDPLTHARELVRRGMDGGALDAYRKGQSAAWQRWMQVCFTLTDDPAELRELLSTTARSITAYIDDTVEAVRARMQAEREELTTGTHAERMATVTLLLEGAPVDTARAEARLGYPLTGPHTAALVWGAPGVDPRHLETTAEGLVEAAAAPRRLTVIANTATLWVWLPIATRPDLARLHVPEGVRVAVGRAATGLDGFRASHLEAATTQRTMDRSSPHRRTATYDDVLLVALLDQDRRTADAFVETTLGALRRADPELRTTALTYLRELCNVSRTADRLYTHRNTVLRRLHRADQLLPQPLADNPVHIAAALELCSWQSP
ncbi:PucR family transcriptional regulator [Actinokineospora bangkokensis]|uniref:Transcriptional regulator n=1 Tax=Actinokineospora bangkokensis TaxID=1193682 RepID=A0A1Q9LL60_9PSEU|nr:helix-turn-helix domain-containing protein [Actinokineospora bangkokensis]OLR92781.1 transcriptional regulator [Actinokineospora bangkokensis]